MTSVTTPQVRKRPPWLLPAVGLIGGMLLVGGLVSGVGVLVALSPPARRALPPDAVVLSESRGAGEHVPATFSYTLEARMTEPEFHAWATRLELEAVATADVPTYQEPGSDDGTAGARATYRDGVGRYHAWAR